MIVNSCEVGQRYLYILSFILNEFKIETVFITKQAWHTLNTHTECLYLCLLIFFKIKAFKGFFSFLSLANKRNDSLASISYLPSHVQNRSEVRNHEPWWNSLLFFPITIRPTDFYDFSLWQSPWSLVLESRKCSARIRPIYI